MTPETFLTFDWGNEMAFSPQRQFSNDYNRFRITEFKKRGIFMIKKNDTISIRWADLLYCCVNG